MASWLVRAVPRGSPINTYRNCLNHVFTVTVKIADTLKVRTNGQSVVPRLVHRMQR